MDRNNINRHGFLLLLIGISACVQWSIGGGGDKQWLLATARLWLAGRELYQDLFQPNLPMIIWLYGGISAIATKAGWQDFHVLVAFTLTLIGLSVFLCAALMQRHLAIASDSLKSHQHILLLGFVFIVWVNPAFFGDREHMAFVALFPYMLRFMPSLFPIAQPLAMRVAIGVLAAFSCSLKPHMLLFIVFSQSYILLRFKRPTRLICLEHIVFGLCGVCYVLAILTLTSEYFNVVVPMLAITYSEHNQGINQVLSYITSSFMLAVTLVEVRLRQTPLRQDIYYLMTMCLAGYAYALVNNGWHYTFYPLQATILYLTCWVYWEFCWLGKQGESKAVFGARACAINLIFNAFLVFAVYLYGITPYAQPAQKEPSLNDRVIALIRHQNVRSFGIMSAHLATWPEIMNNTNAMLATRFNVLSMLVKIHRENAWEDAKYKWIVAYVAQAFAHDLAQRKPEMVIVDDSEEFYLTGQRPQVVSQLVKYADFKKEWEHYGLATSLGDCNSASYRPVQHKGLCKFLIYTRNK